MRMNAWTQVGTLPGPMEASGAVKFGGFLWVVGGYLNGVLSKKVLKSSDGGATWVEVGVDAAPVAVFGHSLVVFNDRMWLAGGSLNAGVSDQVYSSADGATWTTEAALPQETTQHGCVVFEDKIWIVSGYSSGGSSSAKVFAYDGAAWAEVGVDAFPVPMQAFGILVFAGTIWTTGGFLAGLATDSLKIFKLASDRVTWTEVGTNAMPLKLEGHAMFSFGDTLFVAAGINDNIGVTRKVFKTLDGLSWEEDGTDAVPIPVSYMPWVADDERVWLFGGYDPQSSLDVDAVISASVAPPSDSQAIENALCDKLRDDAKLSALLPDGVFYGIADANCKRFALVSMATSHDEPMLADDVAYEEYNYLVKAVVLNDPGGVARAAAERINELLSPRPPARATLTIEGYRLMVMRRIDRVRYPDPDPEDPSIVWQHRGGHYQVMVYPTTT
jgi:hypothetical protein